MTCVALSAGLLAACGEADDDASGAAAANTLGETLDATNRIRSARLTASFKLAPDGLVSLGGPIALRASGPFAAPAGARELPRFDLALAGDLAGGALRANALSTGKAAYLRLDGRSYRVDDGFVAQLAKALADPSGGGFASLGLDPARWITRPRTQGSATVGGVETIRISGDIDVAKLLADIAELLGGAGSGSPGAGLLGPQLRDQIVAGVRSAKVDVWSGAQDRILRQLAVAIDFAFEEGKSPIQGLDGGRVDLRVRLDGVNATSFETTAPKDARPLSRLLEDGGLGALIAGLGAGATGGVGPGDAGEAFLKCLDTAKGRSADVARCASKLAP